MLEVYGVTGSTSLGDGLGVEGVKREDGRWFDIVVTDDEVSLLHMSEMLRYVFNAQ